MLISQVIALGPDHLMSTQEQHFSLTRYKLRDLIMRAHKLIVGDEMYGINIAKIADSHARWKKEAKRNELYREFSKLPFQDIFIENNHAAVYVQWSEQDRKFTFWHLIRDAKNSKLIGILGVGTEYYPDKEEGDVTDTPVKLRWFDPAPLGKSKDHIDGLTVAYLGCTIDVLEILMLLNCKNIATVKYTPPKTETVNVPKNRREAYSYHVLDLSRKQTVYKNNHDVEHFMRGGGITATERRAHFVRGHFKRKKNGLFWWNSFLRNRDSINNGIGFVDKDYKL